MGELERWVGGVDFGEGPRWHEGRLWYSDFWQAAIYAVTPEGEREAIFSGLSDRPSGLGWLPDGRLLVVSMTERKLLRDEGGTLVVHADLGALAPWHCNDMVVDVQGNAWVGNFGFDLEGGAKPVSTNLIRVRPDGVAAVVAEDLRFPNGSVITPDGSTLIVGESFGPGYTAWTIRPDGSLSDRRCWAETPGMAPDGCTLDAEGGIWFADAIGRQVVRVLEGGEFTHKLPTPQPTFACTLGGDDGRTLYVLTAPGSNAEQTAGKAEGAIHRCRVDVPHAGLP